MESLCQNPSFRTGPLLRPEPHCDYAFRLHPVAARGTKGTPVPAPYARLAAGLATPGRSTPKSIVSAFAVVAGQLYVIVLWTGLMLLIYRARPDIERTVAPL
jgi:hypothetical protein